MYWSSLSWVILTALLLGVLNNANQQCDPFSWSSSFVMFGPLWLAGACVLSALQIAIRIPSPLQRGYWRHLGKIFLGILAGTGIGGVLVFGLLSR